MWWDSASLLPNPSPTSDEHLLPLRRAGVVLATSTEPWQIGGNKQTLSGHKKKMPRSKLKLTLCIFQLAQHLSSAVCSWRQQRTRDGHSLASCPRQSGRRRQPQSGSLSAARVRASPVRLCPRSRDPRRQLLRQAPHAACAAGLGPQP